MIYDLHKARDKALDEYQGTDDREVRGYLAGFAEGCKAMLSLLIETDVEGLPDRALEAINEVRRLLNGDE